MRHKRARGCASGLAVTSSDGSGVRGGGSVSGGGAVSALCARWGRCEWFMSLLDAPFFGYSEFDEVLRSMNLRPPGGVATRAEWGRLRAAMCNAFEVYAAPRRLSAAYLAMERRDLAQYRSDARAAMRSAPLPAATDPVSGIQLGPEWYTRYRYPPPVPPPEGTRVLVRDTVGTTSIRQARFISLAEGDHIQVRMLDNEEVKLLPDIDVMLAPPPLLTDNEDVLPAPTLTPLAPRTPAPAPAPATPVTLVRRDPLVALSPRTGTAGGVGAGDVEAEVDVVRLASLIRLVERRSEAVDALRKANGKLEAEINATGAGSTTARLAVQNAAAEVSNLAERTEHILPSTSTNTTGATAGDGDGINSSAAPDAASGLLSLTPRARIGVVGGAGVTGSERPSGVVQKLEDVFGDPNPTELYGGAVRGAAAVSGAVPLGEMPVFTTLGQTPMQPSLQPQPQPRVDMESGPGALELGKALVQRALNDESKWSELRSCDAEARKRVVECTAACVALLIRARTTRDHGAVHELVEHIRTTFRTPAQPLANSALAFQRPP